MKKKTIKELSTKEVTELARNLRNQLTRLGVHLESDEAVDGVPVHLADIYEIARAYQSLIDRLLQSSARKQDARSLIKEVEYHLYDHLPYHIKGLSKGLRKLKKQLETTRLR